MGASKKADGILTDKQIKFIHEYLVDYNGKQAAIRAGYSVKNAENQASIHLANPAIQERLAQIKSKANEKTLLTREYVIEKLKRNADDSIDGTDPDYVASNKALELLGKHLSMFTEKVDHTSSDGSMTPVKEVDLSKLTKSEIEALIKIKKKLHGN